MGADRDRQSHKSIQSVRIFLASPSADTQDARRTVIDAVAELQAEPAHRHLRLELLRWDNDKRRIVCDRSHNPQHDIGQQIGFEFSKVDHNIIGFEVETIEP
ncbi:MAG: hypothetical protein RLY71_152 [Pseudomonadota bacterium]|jgi:hypothetical protein